MGLLHTLHFGIHGVVRGTTVTDGDTRLNLAGILNKGPQSVRIWQEVCRSEVLGKSANVRENVHYHRDRLGEVILVLLSGELLYLGQQGIDSLFCARGPCSYQPRLKEMLVAVDEDEEVLDTCLQARSVLAVDVGEDLDEQYAIRRQSHASASGDGFQFGRRGRI